MTDLYYTPPTAEIFSEVKREATRIWSGYEEPYRSEKLGRINDIQNVGDNLMYLVAMFDMPNQVKLSRALSEESRSAIRDRMRDGGTPEPFIVF